MPGPTPDALAEWAKSLVSLGEQDVANFRTLWQEITELVIPRESTYNETVTKGQERQRFIFDETAPRALELFASFLSTTAHNPASRFFKAVVKKDGEEMRSADAKRYAEKVSEILWSQMNAAKLQGQLHKVDMDLGSIGTSPLVIEKNSDPDAKSRLKFIAGDMQTTLLMENEDGKIDTVIRCVNWSAEQWKKKFPEADLGQAVESLVAGKDEPAKKSKTVKGAHIAIATYEGQVIPGLDQHTIKGMDGKPKYLHIWVILDGGSPKTIEVSGSKRFKFATPRWYTTRGEAYGRSPAMTVMPAIRMANRMKDTIIRAGEKAADPPQLLPDGKLVSPLRLFAGGVSFTDGDVTPQSLIGNGTRYDVSEAMLQSTRDAIREGFFVPLFATPDSPVKTATQVLEETDERNRAVSPMMIRMFEELLEPILDESFMILDEVGLIPAPPGSLGEGATLEMQYISPVLSAQKQNEALGVVRMIEQMIPLAQVVGEERAAEIFDALDARESFLVIQEGSGAPAKILARKSVAEARTAGRQQAQEQQSATEQNIALLDTLSKFQGGAGS